MSVTSGSDVPAISAFLCLLVIPTFFRWRSAVIYREYWMIFRGPEAQFLKPDWGDIADSGIVSSYRPARLHRLAGRYENPMSESAISPSQDLRIWQQISRDPMIWLNTHPLSSLSRRQARPATHEKTEKERQLATTREGGWGAKSYDRKKSWPSIKIFSTALSLKRSWLYS